MNSSRIEFPGLWENTSSKEIIKIVQHRENLETYSLKSNKVGRDFKSIEIVQIHRTNAEHARLIYSTKDLKQNIFILSSDQFKIGDDIYSRFTSTPSPSSGQQ